MSDRFHSHERLKSRKEIGQLFAPGSRTLASYPLRLLYREVENPRGEYPFQVTFVVPKRRFKRAVDRNLLKRRMREAYRLHKCLLAGTQVQAESGKQHALLFMYTGKEEMDYAYIEKKMIKVLHQLAAVL